MFAEKVLSAQASSSAAAAKASFEKTCSACQKTYSSENTYQNHLSSQKHRLRVATLQNGEQAVGGDETSSIISSTFSLGEPISLVTTETVDADAEAEFSEVVNGIKETFLDKSEPLSRRPPRTHHSSNQDRTEPRRSTAVPSNRTTGLKTTASDDVPMNRCMFCNYDSPSFKLSVMHMSKFHGMFIPEQSYLVDLEGLIRYLYGKIIQLYECLYCHKFKSSMSGIQTHMRDKGHCMIAFDSEEEMIEVGQFYDFSSTYSDDEASSDDGDMEGANITSDGAKIGPKRSQPMKTVICSSNGDQEMGDEDENAEGWETDSSASSLDSEYLTAIPIDHTHAYERLPLHRHHSHTDPRPHRTVDGFHSHAHSHHAVFRSDYELHLPSGRTAGHRALSRYYRQNLHNYPTAAEHIENRMIENASPNNEIVTGREPRGRQLITRAQGGIGMLGVTEAKKREAYAVEKREQKREQRNLQQYQWGVNKRGNAQKHFRDPLLQ